MEDRITGNIVASIVTGMPPYGHQDLPR